MTGTEQPETIVSGADVPLSPELDKLGPAPSSAAGEPAQDTAPSKGRRKRSGTSGAERARRAKAAGTTPATPRARTTRAKAPNIKAGMTNLYTMVGVGASFVPTGKAAEPFPGTISQAVGESIVASAAQLGEVWEQAAKDDPRVRDALEKLLAVSTLGQIVAAHLPIVMTGLVAAGTIPAGVLSGVAPEAPAT